jgi:hypothetical protein
MAKLKDDKSKPEQGPKIRKPTKAKEAKDVLALRKASRSKPCPDPHLARRMLIVHRSATRHLLIRQRRTTP